MVSHPASCRSLTTSCQWQWLGSKFRDCAILRLCKHTAQSWDCRGWGTGPAGLVLAGALFWHPGPMTREHCKGSFIYESEIAASGMWCTKSSLSANLHVLSMSRARRSRKLQSSSSEAQRCYEGPSRQLKNKGEKFFSVLCTVLIGTTHLYALPSAVAVPLQKTLCHPWIVQMYCAILSWHTVSGIWECSAQSQDCANS